MSSSISVNDAMFAYSLSGQGVVVVFLHGWMCNQEFWRLQCDLLSGQGYRCLALDFRGHGKSEVTNAGYSIEQLADDVWEILKALHIDKVVLVGHSMGGMVAQQFCLDHGGQVMGLVLVTTIAADRENRMISKRIEKDSRQEQFPVAFDRHFDLWFSNRTPGDVRDWVKTQMKLTPAGPALALVRSYAGFDQTHRLREIRSPTLVIGTQSDHSTPASQSQELAQFILGSDLVLIDDCGHFPMLEKTEKISQELLAFLQKNEGAKKLA